MKLSSRLIVGLTLTSFMVITPASAQDATTQVGNATVTVGAGTAILDLPDFKFTNRSNAFGGTASGKFTDADDFSDEIGWNVNGTITAPMGGNQFISLSGFWANIEDDDNTVCTQTTTVSCKFTGLVNTLGNNSIFTVGVGNFFTTNVEREVDQAGVSLESKWLMTPGVMGVTQAPNARYFSLGADWRAIYQDTTLRSVHNVFAGSLRYSEDLDTDYYGAFAAYGGDYSPFLLNGLWQRWGLQSSFRLQGGVYYADTNFSGAMSDTFTAATNGALSLSDDDVAFIGGLTLETRKQIGQRATLSLKSEYEYYSYVPEMAYNNFDADPGTQNGTVINDDDAYSMRTSLRLTIKLGPDSLFEEPMK